MKDNNRPKKLIFIRSTYPVFYPVLKWAAALLISYGALNIDEPLMSGYRTTATLLIPTLSAILIIFSYRALKAYRGHFLKKLEKALFILVLASATVMLSEQTALFQFKKMVVLNTADDLLNRLGRHFIVGYRRPDEVVRLLENRAIGGVYITARNIGNKSVDEVRQELGTFQTIALSKGGPPLFVAADQEGGKVSRLSPLLPAMPALSGVISTTCADSGQDHRVKTYAALQAKQLAGLGINLNLSPVVDLKTDRFSHKLNIHSRIDQRAISADVDTVTHVAGIYCRALLDHGVRPTLKHFPGLGSVGEDTHFKPGRLDGSKDFLECNDWRPFKEISARTDPFIMLGHVRVSAVDPDLPASLSPRMITHIIRNEWKFEGVLITDDLNMGAITQRKEGIGKAAVRALNAGADLILLSHDGNQYYNAMYEMIRAYETGKLDAAVLKKSSQRLLAHIPADPR